MADKTPPEPFRVVLELRPSRDGEAPVINRLRRCLKALGRAYGFRVTSIAPEQPPATTGTPKPSPPA
jgi:hypothetical protein